MKQIKSKERVKDFAEVFTATREVREMCDLVSEECLKIDSTFLEPACGTGNFLAEILERKFSVCKSIDDGLTALASIYGIDIQGDNVLETRERLVKMYVQKFPYASNMKISEAKLILAHNIVQNDFLKLSPHDLDIWACGGVLPVYCGAKMDGEEREENDKTKSN